MTRLFVVQVHTGAEVQAAMSITDIGIRAIAPRLRQRRKERPGMTWRQKQAVRQQPLVEVSLFPGYILAQFDREDPQWGEIRRRFGVIGLVPVVGEKPCPIPKVEAAWLMARLDPTGFWIDKVEEKPRPWERFEIGQRVRVADGPFTGFPAMIEASDAERIKVLIGIFGRETPSELNWDQVEAL